MELNYSNNKINYKNSKSLNMNFRYIIILSSNLLFKKFFPNFLNNNFRKKLI